MRKAKLVGLLLGLVAVASLAAVALVRAPGTRLTWGAPRGAVGLISLEGIIATGSSGSGLLGNVLGSDSVLGELREAREDPATRAVVLRVNSPGGSAAGAQEIAREVRRLREAGKVVVTSMGDVAASGAYWVACASQRILANPGTITGSIGVIMEVQNFQGLYGKLGIGQETIKSGPHKDMGSPARPLEPEERQILQGMVDDIFDQFVETVAEGRREKLTREQVRALADGRIFTGRQALANGLVDELGDLRDAIQQAAELAGIADSYQVKTFRKTSPWLELLEALGVKLPPFGREIAGTAGLALTPWQRLEWAWWSARQLLSLPWGL